MSYSVIRHYNRDDLESTIAMFQWQSDVVRYAESESTMRPELFFSVYETSTCKLLGRWKDGKLQEEQND